MICSTSTYSDDWLELVLVSFLCCFLPQLGSFFAFVDLPLIRRILQLLHDFWLAMSSSMKQVFSLVSCTCLGFSGLVLPHLRHLFWCCPHLGTSYFFFLLVPIKMIFRSSSILLVDFGTFFMMRILFPLLTIRFVCLIEIFWCFKVVCFSYFEFGPLVFSTQHSCAYHFFHSGFLWLLSVWHFLFHLLPRDFHLNNEIFRTGSYWIPQFNRPAKWWLRETICFWKNL